MAPPSIDPGILEQLLDQYVRLSRLFRLCLCGIRCALTLYPRDVFLTTAFEVGDHTCNLRMILPCSADHFLPLTSGKLTELSGQVETLQSFSYRMGVQRLFPSRLTS